MNSSLKGNFLDLKEKLDMLEKEIELNNDGCNNEERLKELENKIDEIKQSQDSLVNLNVGGKIFKTNIKTLMNSPNSLFAKLASSISYNQKEIFIDRSYTHFPIIMDYLRTKQICLKNMKKYDKEDLFDELEYYGLSEIISIKKANIEIGWDQNASKSGECTVSENEKNILNINSRSCYCHFLTDRTFTNENFMITLDSSVTQTDNYYYIGLINESYSTTGNCMCCNPSNCWYIQCDGSTHINGIRTENNNLAWHSEKIIISLKVLLEKREMYIIIEGKGEVGPMTLSGNTFRVVAGHCNTGNGQLIINECYEINE